jgi:ABC-type transport system substrate-binding protein
VPAGPWRRRPPLLALVLLLALAACTGGRSGGRAATGHGAAPRRGGTLAIALVAPASLDPAQATSLGARILAGNLFEGLTALDAAGAVRPAVAASWSSDPGLRRWSFRLRPDARWADGGQVRADDFVFAWQRLGSPTTRPRPPPADALLGAVSGYQAFAAGRAARLAGLQAPDPATLVVQLDRPLADLPAVVASPRLAPLPHARAGRGLAAWLARPAGDGPFQPAGRYAPGRPLTLVRNPRYPGPPALLDKVRVDTVPDEQTAWLELQSGQVAFAPVPADQADAARAVFGASADGRTRPGLLQGPALAVWTLDLDLKSKPLADPRRRRAIALAIDRPRLAAALAGTWAPAAGLVPPGVPGAGQATCAACAHDPAQARALLAQAGGTLRLSLRVRDAAADRRAAQLLAEDLARVGVHLDVQPTSSSSSSPRPAQLAATGWAADTPRMDAFLFDRFHSHGGANPGGYASPAADRLLEAARATPDEAAATRADQQAEALLLGDLPAVPVLVARHAAVLAAGVAGFDLTPWSTVDLAAVSLSA